MLVLGSSFFLYQGNTVTHLLFFLASGIAMSALIVGGALQGMRVHATGSPRVLIASSLVAIILMSIALGSLYFMVERYRGQLALSSAIATFQESEDLVATVEKLNTALQIDETNDAVLRTASQAMVLRLAEVLQDTGLEPDVARDQFTAALQNAVTTARRATEVAPWNVQNWLQLAGVYEQTIGLVDGVEQLAVDAYEEVQQRDPYNPSVPLAQGRVFMAAADIVEARLNAPASQQEELQLTNEQREELTKEREDYLAQARAYLEEAVSLKEEYAAGRFLLAQVLDRQGEVESAVGETRRVVAANPQDAGALLQLGILDIKVENYEEARAALERAKLLVEDYANARYFLGIAYARLDQRNAAIAEFEWLREKNPENQLVQQVLTNLREGRDPLAAPAQEPESAPPVAETGGAQQQPLQ
jgi:tetratricopeptide (TPR) repeat protein